MLVRIHFIKLKKRKPYYYDAVGTQSARKIPGTESFILLDHIRNNKTIWKNAGASITDIGDGIINVEFYRTNSIGGEVIAGVNKAIELAEKDFAGLVISNEGANFSAGASCGYDFYDGCRASRFNELNFAIKAFQNTMMRCRYSSIPVVVALNNMALGGSCEMSMHSI